MNTRASLLATVSHPYNTLFNYFLDSRLIKLYPLFPTNFLKRVLLKPNFHSRISPVTSKIFVDESQKNKLKPKVFHQIRGIVPYRVVIYPNRYWIKGSRKPKSIFNMFRGRNFRQRRAKSGNGNPALIKSN